MLKGTSNSKMSVSSFKVSPFCLLSFSKVRNEVLKDDDYLALVMNRNSPKGR